MIQADAPLLFLDSGVGGLSVLAPTLAMLPRAPIVYVGDFAGLPYGEKSEIEVATRVCALLGRLTERYAPQLIVIACNTASTIALAHVRSVLEVPVVGTVPAIKPAALGSHSGVIGLLGTEATIRQPYVDRLAAEFASGQVLIRSAAPQLVDAAEAKLRGDAVDQGVYRGALARLIAAHPAGGAIDQIVLGCTHFPLVAAELTAAARTLAFETQPQFVDGGMGIARRVAALTQGQAWPDDPRRLALFSGNDDRVVALASAFASHGITDIRRI